MRWLRRTGQILLHVEDSPTRVALAFALGVFIAFFPILGVHTGLAIAVALAFRLNKVALLVGAWTNNPWTIAPMYSAGTVLGAFILGVSPASLGAVDWSLSGRAFYASLVTGLRPLVLPFVVGNLVLGAAAGAVAFLGLRALLARRRRRSRPGRVLTVRPAGASSWWRVAAWYATPRRSPVRGAGLEPTGKPREARGGTGQRGQVRGT
jgi:uncharacterized protein (DUF2062 family)